MEGSDRVKGPQHWPGGKQEGGFKGAPARCGGCQEGQGHWPERQGDRAQVRAARWRAGPWVSRWGKATAGRQGCGHHTEKGLEI